MRTQTPRVWWPQGLYTVCPVRTWPPTVPQSPYFNSHYLRLPDPEKPVLRCPLPTAPASPGSLGQSAALTFPHYGVFKENCELSFVRLAVPLNEKVLCFMTVLVLALLCYLGEVLTAPSVSSSLPSQDQFLGK